MDWRPFIHRDPAILCGKPVIKGTRISVELVLQMLSGDWSIDDVLDSYPHLSREQVQACLAFAADALDRERAPLASGAA